MTYVPDEIFVKIAFFLYLQWIIYLFFPYLHDKIVTFFTFSDLLLLYW